jgi:prepilin-type N-terminal cleavage/methylation domain-containing protein
MITNEYSLKENGYTLVELMVVMAIAIFIASVSIRQFVSYQKQSDIPIIKTKVVQMQEALDSFISLNCRAGLNPAPTIAGLVANNLINATDAISPVDSTNFQLEINWIKPYRHTVKVSAGSNGRALNIQSVSGATGVDGIYLEFSRPYKPNNSSETHDFRAMFEPGCD